MNKVFHFFKVLLLFPFSLLYGAIIGIRNYAYSRGFFPVFVIDELFVISVGNIEVGGTGKTPFAAFLIEYFTGLGFRCAYLSRGYGRKTKGFRLINPDRDNGKEVGDEALMIARRYPHVPVAVCENRVLGAKALLKRASFQVLILDDAFQHRRIHRDLDILVVNGSRTFFKEKLLPLGRLREPRSQYKRADLIVVNKVASESQMKSFERRISKPLLFAQYVPHQCVRGETKASFPLSFLQHRPIILLSAIAWNQHFYETVQQLQAYILRHYALPDHFPISKNLLLRISKKLDRAQKSSYYRHEPILLVTEKDYARMVNDEELEPLLHQMPVYYLEMKLKFIKGYQVCESVIEEKLKKHKLWSQKSQKNLERPLITSDGTIRGHPKLGLY